MQRHATCPRQPGVSTQLNSWAKEEGYERFTFCQRCKKTGRTYHWAPFLTKRMGCSLKTIEKKSTEMAEQQVPTTWCLFWGSGSKHASKNHTQKNIEIKHPGKIYIPTKSGGAAKSWFVHKALPLCRENFLLAPIHFVGFLQDSAAYSYK